MIPACANGITSGNNQIIQTDVVQTTAIPNFSKLDANFYRSGQPEGDNYKDLSALGIKTIISLRLSGSNQTKNERKIVELNGMKFVNIPLNPFLHPNYKQIQAYYNVLNDPQNLPVLVHCKYGQDRTGIMTALYRVKAYNWNYDKAYNEMIDFGYHKTLYSRQKHFLWEYIMSERAIKTMKQKAKRKA